MGRWQPNARERLERAAMELYEERGFEQTTVAAIAERAGLTERTFFRHYADKREVLFGGAGALQELFTGALAGAPGAATPIDAMGVALDAVGEAFRDRRPYAVRRQAVVRADANLLERELTKLASLSAALAGALRTRGVAEPAASLVAEAGIAVFKVAFERWLDDPDERELTHFTRESLAELRAATAAG